MTFRPRILTPLPLPSSSTLRHKNSDETDRHNNAFPFPNNSLVIKQISPPSERTNSNLLPRPFSSRARVLWEDTDCFVTGFFCPPPPIVLLLHARLVNAKKIIIANGSFCFFYAEPYVAPVRADTIIAIYLPSPRTGRHRFSHFYALGATSARLFFSSFILVPPYGFTKSSILFYFGTPKDLETDNTLFRHFFARIKTNPAATSHARNSETRVGDGFFCLVSHCFYRVYTRNAMMQSAAFGGPRRGEEIKIRRFEEDNIKRAPGKMAKKEEYM